MKKMNYTRLGLAIVLTISSTAMTTEAFATSNIRRADCLTPGRAGYMGRNMGARNAARIVAALWQRLGRTCDQVDRLATIIAETPLARPAVSGEFAACFYQGYTDTLWDQIGQTYDRCSIRCFNEGSEIGRISAQGYCAASVAVGGLLDPGFIAQPPLPFCGENLVFGCKSQYISTATWEIPQCVPYTQGFFAQTFDNSVRQDCFVPSDVPIRDGDLGRYLGLDLANASSDLF